MTNICTFTDECEQQLLDDIEKYLKELSSNDFPKIYFAGAPGSGVDDFEHQSNYIKIGILANNETVALVLLRFLRIIIDNREEFLYEDSFSTFQDEYDNKNDTTNSTIKYDKEINMNEIIKRLAEKEKDYMNSFLLDEQISTNFSREELNFTRCLDEIDIWTLPRIMREIRDLY